MIGRIWQKLVAFFQGLFGRRSNKRSRSSIAAIAPAEAPKPLENADYEFLFMQLLEGVAHGWQQQRVLKFISDLEGRTTETQWVEWLRGFGEKLLTSPAPNQELALRMLALSEIGCGELGEVAGAIATLMLQRQEVTTMVEPENELSSTLNFANEAFGDVENQAQAITLDQLWELLQQDPDLVQQLAELLQIDTTDPEIIIQTLINQANNAS